MSCSISLTGKNQEKLVLLFLYQQSKSVPRHFCLLCLPCEQALCLVSREKLISERSKPQEDWGGGDLNKANLGVAGELLIICCFR